MFVLPHLNKENRDLLVKLMAEAIRHAKRVSRREHIKANRIEGVEQFVVSLRRAISHSSPFNGVQKDLVGCLCHKGIWYDIGELNSVSWPRAVSFGRSEVEPLVDAANAHLPNTSDYEEILYGLEEIEQGITGMQLAINDARRINEQSEVVLEKLAEVFC